MNHPEELPFVYREFYDYPRLIVVRLGDVRLLLDSPFDSALDDYRDHYQVYRLPIGFEPPEGSWEHLVDQSLCHLGEIPVRSVHFDSTRRRTINRHSLARFCS